MIKETKLEADITENAPSPSKAEPAPIPVDIVLPLTTNDSGKVMIQTVSGSKLYPYNSYIITSKSGESIVLDAHEMPNPEMIDIKPVALLQTHKHPDHSDNDYTKYYDVPKLMSETGEIIAGSFKILTIASSHSNDNITADGGNVIVIVEVDGLRIAHMGDVGQTKLTDEQLVCLGKIDIAFMQFENSYSDMNLQNEKGFTLIEQLNPFIIIPTHYSKECLTVMMDKYGAITEMDNILTISKDEIPKKALNLYTILNTHKYK